MPCVVYNGVVEYKLDNVIVIKNKNFKLCDKNVSYYDAPSVVTANTRIQFHNSTGSNECIFCV